MSFTEGAEGAAVTEATSTPAPSEPPSSPSGEQTATPAPEATPRERFDLTPYADHVVTVKVDGQDVEVPVKDLPQGYMRHADYTRKTQEVAEMRKRLQQAEALATAFDRDPTGTLKALNEAYGTKPEGGDDWESMTPEEQRIAQIEEQLKQQQAHATRNQIENEFKTLEAEFGDVDRDAVVNFALRNNVSVTAAYRLMTYDDLRSGNKKLNEELGVVEQKRGAQTVHAGGSTQAGSTTAPPKKFNSVREAALDAIRQVQGQR